MSGQARKTEEVVDRKTSRAFKDISLNCKEWS